MSSALASWLRRAHAFGLMSAVLCIAVFLGCERKSQSAEQAAGSATSRGAARTAAESIQRTPLPALTGSAVSSTRPAATRPAADDVAPPVHAPVAAVPATREVSRHIAYYFHRTLRCATCLAIERQAREAIEVFFGGELTSGALEWYAINFEEPEYAHFEKDFELTSQALVLVEMNRDRVTRWKLLPKVWELVDDPYAFQDYVAREVGMFLSGEESAQGE